MHVYMHTKRGTSLLSQKKPFFAAARLSISDRAATRWARSVSVKEEKRNSISGRKTRMKVPRFGRQSSEKWALLGMESWPTFQGSWYMADGVLLRERSELSVAGCKHFFLPPLSKKRRFEPPTDI